MDYVKDERFFLTKDLTSRYRRMKVVIPIVAVLAFAAAAAIAVAGTQAHVSAYGTMELGSA